MPTHFFHSGMTGAPTNTSAAGSTLEIIRACLVTGFNLRSVVSASVSGGVMTLNYAAPHGYEDKVLIRLDGAVGGSIVQRVTTAAGASSLTIPAPGFADGAVSGTLSTRVAPADWEEVFTAAGVGVFRSKQVGVGCTRFFYRVADAAAGNIRMLRGYEDMTDVNTGTGLFPTLTQEPGDGRFISRPTSATPQPWAFIADQRTVYFFLATSSAVSNQPVFFGDEQPLSAVDLFLASLITSPSLSQATDRFRPRIAAGTGTAVPGTQRSLFGSWVGAYPSPVGGGMVFVRPVLTHDTTSTSALRGIMRGLMHCSAMPVPSGALFTVFPSVQGVAGRVVVVRDSQSTSSAIAFPLDEDWA